ncbi:ATP-binding cassette domain-containing protein [Ruegeria lacuscaerulensis]|uniref:ATP-binding cassette domain-containing protein n=1 Tax=Ruegeria lacuscaerulensis TaxID=55218 RepID=UPI001480D73E
MTGLSVRNVSYAYGEKRALDDVSFHVPQGAFCALLGPNGAGKSTLFSLLTRLFTTAQGVIEVAGFDISKQPRQALAQIGVVFQQPTLDLDLTVHRNLSYFAALHGLAGRDAETRISAALDRLDMAERAAERTRDLNGGHRRRLEIARSLIHSPSVLLLDEPTVGLDAAARKAITQHVHALSQQDGLTVLWATHLTDEIEPDDHVAILHRGKLLKQELCSDLTSGQPLQHVFLSMTGATA